MWEIVLILIILAVLLSRGDKSHSGGVHVKPRTNTPRPKVSPAPQSPEGLNKKSVSQ